MPINQQFLAARAAEHRNRQLSYLPALPLTLPLSSGRLVKVAAVHLTPRIELELELIRSPFLVGGKPNRWDAWRFLWRMHPDFVRPDGEQPNRGHRAAPISARLMAPLRRARLAWLSARLLWPLAIFCIKGRFDLARQDDPAADAEAVPAPAAPKRCEVDELCRYFSPRGLNRDQILDSPTSWLMQLFRSDLLALPDGEMEVIDRSDALLNGA